jgi:hypothetical protein
MGRIRLGPQSRNRKMGARIASDGDLPATIGNLVTSDVRQLTCLFGLPGAPTWPALPPTPL